MTQVGTEEVRELTLHGERIVYRRAGSGPVLVLVHGITSDSRTWEGVMPRLARDFTVHRAGPDRPRGDPPSRAATTRSARTRAACATCMAALGCDRATFVGHSLGGGIVMQLAYQFPELCERLVLVDSGGLGRDVSMLLRAATLPGSEFVMPLLAAARVFDAARILTGALGRVGLRPSTSDLAEIAAAHRTLSDPGARAAFVQTLRAVVDPGGQRVSASSRLYLAQHIPLLLCGASATGSSPSPMLVRPTPRSREAAWRCSPTRDTSPSSMSRRCSPRRCWTSWGPPIRPCSTRQVGASC